MQSYKYFMQEDLMTYYNPLEERTSKLIMSYLKFYNYVQIIGNIIYSDHSYKIFFSNKENIATLHFGRDIAVLYEFTDKSEYFPRIKTDFIREERLEYLGDFRNKCIVYTHNGFKESLYFSPINYQGMKEKDYYENKIPTGTIPTDKRKNNFTTAMMRIIASADYANEIRCLREGEPVYNGKQVKTSLRNK